MAMDDHDRQVISRLSPAALARLDRQLRRAMALYYDNAYSLALPILRGIAARADTLDILYWYATAAQRSGKFDVAITKFQSMLKRHPDLDQVRLDLAMTYLQKGDKESAVGELKVLAAATQESEAKAKAVAFLAGMERVGKKFHANIRFGGGVQYDDNINVLADDLPVTLTTAKVSGGGGSLFGDINTTYDLGKPGGWYWRNRLNGFSLDHFDSNAFDYADLTFLSGLDYRGEQWAGQLAGGFVKRFFGDTSLSDAWFLNPEVAYSPKKSLELRAGYRFEQEDLTAAINRNQDNDTQTLTFTPTWLMKSPDSKRLTLVSLTGTIAGRNAVTNQFSYAALGISPLFFHRFESGIGTMLMASFSDKDYDGNAPSPGAPAQREDQEYSFNASVSKGFLDDKLSLAASYTYTQNDSNTIIYDYNKHVVGLNLGVALDFWR